MVHLGRQRESPGNGMFSSTSTNEKDGEFVYLKHYSEFDMKPMTMSDKAASTHQR
jgi:hypothetical protein